MSDKIVIQTICHVQSQTVDVKFLDPAFHALHNMIFHSIIAEIELYKVIITFPAFIPETIVVIGIATEINPVKPILVC